MKTVTKFMGLIYVLCVKLKVYVHVEFFRFYQFKCVLYCQEHMMTSFFIAEGGGRACNFIFWPW